VCDRLYARGMHIQGAGKCARLRDVHQKESAVL
jgi:hypothetical protein